MKAVVVGCGILGITTAWFLRRAGLEVENVDRAAGPGLETSFANGALLHPSYVAPWNEPGIHWSLLKWMGKEDAPMLLRPRHLLSYSSWGLKFISHSTPRRYLDSALRNFALARYSSEVQRQLRKH